MFQAIKDAPARAYIAATTGLATMIASANTVLAQAASGTADVTGALDTNQEALTAVEDSSFTGEGVKEGAQNVTNAILYAIGALGILLACIGIYQLWKHQKEGDRAQGDMSQGIFMIAIGGCMTIGAVITAIFPNLFIGGT